MKDFSDGIELGVNDDDYLATLLEYPDGLVLSFNKNRQGKYSAHKTICSSMCFDLAKKNQTRRSGKVICNDFTEIKTWIASKAIDMADLSQQCPQCK